MIVQSLLEIQNRHGFLPDAELKKLARDAGVPLYRIEEVASFFPAFRQERDRPADVEVRVCRDYTCHLRGAAALLAADGLRKLAVSLSRETGRSVRVEGVSCLGRCDRGPAVWVERREPPMPEGEHAWVYAGRTPKQLASVLRALVEGAPRPEPNSDARYQPHTNASVRYELPVVAAGKNGPAHHPLAAADWEINPYGRDRTTPTYAAVRKVIAYLEARGGSLPNPAGVPAKEFEKFVQAHHPFLWEMKVANVLGMGGAQVPAYTKWLDVWQQPGPEKYIVANGDESEPGTFKDRELLLRLPHLVVEGVILAGLLTGATKGYVYIRHEYFEQIHAVREEVRRAEELGACGADVFGSGIGFPVEVFESPGGYICGEQSALIEAMEDRRAQPRNRPPELGTNGLRDKPTVVNNVETLAWAPFVVLRGGAAYADTGWRVPDVPALGFKGRRLFSVSGDVKRPGVYEVPVGLPLGTLLTDPEYCGGIIGPLKAVAPSGPSGGLLPAQLPVDPKFRDRLADGLKRVRERSGADADFAEWHFRTHLPPGAKTLDLLTLPLDLGALRNIQTLIRLPVESMLGAGLAVYAGTADVLDHAVNHTRFYRNESCGKCVPCRVGSQKLVRIGADLQLKRDAGTLTPDEVAAVKADVGDITRALQQTSICGLGFVAPLPLATALTYFPADVERRPG